MIDICLYQHPDLIVLSDSISLLAQFLLTKSAQEFLMIAYILSYLEHVKNLNDKQVFSAIYSAIKDLSYFLLQISMDPELLS